jgi:tetratricopeptide (TPR) repeat protein
LHFRAIKLIVVTVAFFSMAEPLLANYRAATQFFQRRDYVSAAGAYFQAYGYPKVRGEKKKAEWGLAQSLHRLGFYYSASKYYSIIVRRGTRNNPFFRQALEELGKVNSTISLGQSHIVQLFKTRIRPSDVPGPARGFYFYYLGIEAFTRNKYEKAQGFFKKVGGSSKYYVKAQFHLGVVQNLRGNHSGAISYFEKVRSSSGNSPWVREQANLNIARIHYEMKRYRESLRYYAYISRGSDNWLQALFEASWAFFMIQKHNNTLGTIHTLHSPFYINRFYPESYILQSITFLRLCRFKQVKSSLARFRNRYKNTYGSLRKMLNTYDKNPKGFFKLVYDYRTGNLNKYNNAHAIIDALSRTDIYREAGNTLRFSDIEMARLDSGSMRSRWAQSGLLDEVKSFLKNKKQAAIKNAGRRLYSKGAGYFAYLSELSNQTKLINTEMLLGRIDRMRQKLNVGQADKKSNFIGGLQPLVVGQEYEYWPFQGEYWEDELGTYVYNVDAQCNKVGRKKGGKKGK